MLNEHEEIISTRSTMDSELSSSGDENEETTSGNPLDSDTASHASSDEDDFCKEYVFGEEGIQPYSFEPVCSNSESEEDTSVDMANPIETDDASIWCECGKCVASATIREKVCCKKPVVFDTDVFESKVCITETDAFLNVCLNRFVLQAAIGNWNDLTHDNRNLGNKNYRFIAYRQYISWSYGYLGRRKRKPLPNCAIIKIREIYPDPNNVYIPYAELS